MTEFHPHPAEQSHPDFRIELALEARKKSWIALDEISKQIREGMNEEQLKKLALDVCHDLGAKKHWHRPYLRFAAATQLTFNDPMTEGTFLAHGDPMYVDLGPVWKLDDSGILYEGDVGKSFVFRGDHPVAQKCIDATERLFFEGKESFKNQKATGTELYQLLGIRAAELGYELVMDANGHRISDFPHQQYTKKNSKRMAHGASQGALDS